MVEDIDLWQTAKLLLDEFGDDAPIEAAQRADAMLERGDVEGSLVWQRAVHEHPAWLRSPDVLPFPVHIVTGGNIRDGLVRGAPCWDDGASAGPRSPSSPAPEGRETMSRAPSAPDPRRARPA